MPPRWAALAAALIVVSFPTAAGTHRQDRLLLSHPYPIEAVASYPGGLFHWIDSLAGTSVGKTVPAHRAQYLRLFGQPDSEDLAQLAVFVVAREEHARYEAERAARSGLAPRASAMLSVFCASATVEDALATVKPELNAETWNRFANALAYFRPKYDVVWNGGAIPQAFLSAARSDSGRLRLEALLATIVRLYGVDPLAAPPPRIALVPVPSGWGTHAEAVGSVLLLEIRTDDTLAEQASVIVHENSHFLWTLIPAERRQRLATAASGVSPTAQETYLLLHEAIPTALGQGVADHAFRPADWSLDSSWYHTDDVDRCAKRIYPVILGALDDGLTLDEALIKKAIVAAETAGGQGLLSPPDREPMLPTAKRAFGERP
jgi:hypothetical protein